MESEEAAANLAAQAQTRSALKRDLTDLTQLADAQTKHIQRAKIRQMQAMQAMQASKAGGQGGGGGGQQGAPRVGPPPPLLAGATPARAVTAAGGLATALTNEVHGFPQQQHDLDSVASRVSSPLNSMSPSSQGGPLVSLTSSQGSAGRAPSTPTMGRQGVAEDSPMGGRSQDWSAVAPRHSVLSSSPSPPLLSTSPPSQQLSQHQQQQPGAPPLQHRLRETKSLLDRTEPRNKWAVLIQASLRLLPHESSTYKQFLVTAVSFLNSYNGPPGADVAQALRSCVDPRVFDPKDITRSQQRMANVYAQARRGQR